MSPLQPGNSLIRYFFKTRPLLFEARLRAFLQLQVARGDECSQKFSSIRASGHRIGNHLFEKTPPVTSSTYEGYGNVTPVGQKVAYLLLRTVGTVGPLLMANSGKPEDAKLRD